MSIIGTDKNVDIKSRYFTSFLIFLGELGLFLGYILLGGIVRELL